MVNRSLVSVMILGGVLAGGVAEAKGLAALGGGPGPGFQVFSVDNKGGGWIINHMPGRGDTLWGCKDLLQVQTCTQVYFNEWKTGSKLEFLHVTDKSQKGWLVLSAPAMADELYACADPEGTPVCTRMEMELRMPMAGYKRVWPAYDCEFECGDKASCADSLPEWDARRLIETAEKGDMLLQAGNGLPGPSNLYACRGLESAPMCQLSLPNWLALDRQDVGIKTLEDIENEQSDGTVTYGPGVRIKKMDEETVGWDAGLREGDVITKVGPFETNTAKHARYLMLQYPALASFTLTLEGGKEVVITPRRKPAKSK